MSFLTRALMPGYRAKLYVHEYGYERVFGSTPQGIEDGIKYFTDALSQKSRELISPNDFVLGAVWGDDGNSKVAEMFVYKEIKEWPGNPTVYTWIFRNGIYMPWERQVACEDAILAFSDESTFRRKTKSPEEFLVTNAPSRFFPDQHFS